MNVIPPLSFPYPVRGPKRPIGNGCNSCVHKAYCTAYYWYIRYQEVRMSDDFGCACASWSNQKADLLDPKEEGDLYFQDKMNIDGIAQEKNQNGCE